MGLGIDIRYEALKKVVAGGRWRSKEPATLEEGSLGWVVIRVSLIYHPVR